MKNIRHAHLLFERSGTFKKAFEYFGIPATDYDLEKEHESVIVCDIFHCINDYFVSPTENIFSHMSPKDVIIAFFPCTYFSDQSQLISRGDSFSMKDYSFYEKLNISRRDMQFRADYFADLCKLVQICLNKNLRLVIENPFGNVNFLKWFFPLKPSLVIKDRRIWGDYFKKPTQFFFVNCEPEFCLFPELDAGVQKKSIEKLKGFARSRISPEFARNFVQNVILDYGV